MGAAVTDDDLKTIEARAKSAPSQSWPHGAVFGFMAVDAPALIAEVRRLRLELARAPWSGAMERHELGREVERAEEQAAKYRAALLAIAEHEDCALPHPHGPSSPSDVDYDYEHGIDAGHRCAAAIARAALADDPPQGGG
jgi:hypothetical protein